MFESLKSAVGRIVGTGRPAVERQNKGAQLGFTDSTDGRGQRLAWQRYSPPWSLNSPYVVSMGGYVSRERNQASAVATDLASSNSVIATLLENLTTHNVGAGLTLSSKLDAAALGITPEEARALSSAIEKAWRQWADNPLECDLTGRHSLHEMAAAGFQTWLRTGELLATVDWQKMPHASTRTKLQLLDPSQLDQSRTVVGPETGQSTIAGVIFGVQGRVVGYYIIPVKTGQWVQAQQPVVVPATTSWGRQKVIHLFELKTAGQLRGLSPLVAALTPSHEKASLGEFTLDAALLQTQYALTIESDLPYDAALRGLQVEGASPSPFVADPLGSRLEFYKGASIDAAPGRINHLAPGDKLKMNRSETPNATFEPFDRSLARSASKAAGSSYEDVSGDYSAVNFSASRMASETPHRINMRRRKSITERFYRAAFAAWLEEAMETGVVELPKNAPPFYAAKSAYLQSKWLGQGRVQPDPLKAAQATVLELTNNLTTLGDALAERGMDLEETLEARKTERDMLKAAGFDEVKT